MNEEQHQITPSSASGFLLFSIMMLIVLTFAVIQPLIPNDFFPYLRIGEEVLRTGKVPSTEFMTYTNVGKPALYFYWLPSLILLGIYRLGGLPLTSLFSLICIGSFFFLLWECLKELKITSLTSAVILSLISLIAASYFPTRPQILAFPLFGISLLLILRWQHGKMQWLWLLPLIALLWANIHGSFIVLFFMLIPAVIFGAGDRKRLFIFTILSLLATFVNVYGLRLWSNMFSVVGNLSNQRFGMEWKPLANQGWQANILFALILLLPLLVAITKPHIHWLYWIWFVGFGWMALSSIRYVIWFLPILAILLCALLDPIVQKVGQNSQRFTNRPLNIALGICLMLFPLILLPGIRETWWQKSPPMTNEETPLKAAAWLKGNPELPDHLWADFSFSTYLTYALPERKLFSTNRIEDLSTEQIEDYFAISSARYDWESILARYDIRLLMVSIQDQPDLIQAASASPHWQQVYGDDQAMIYARVSP